MIIQSGKFKDRTSHEVVLKQGDYVAWYAHEYPDTILGKELRRLVGIFNSKPFTTNCYTCGGHATRATSYQNNFDFMWWCDNCNPYGSGANAGKLTQVLTYQEALMHIDATGGARREWKKKIIIELARGKGLPKRITVQAIKEFFS